MLVTTLVEKTVDGKIVKLEKFETETFCQEVGTSKFIHFFRIFTLKSHQHLETVTNIPLAI